MKPEHLSLAMLEQFDPHAPKGGTERRFLCPLCGEGKPKDEDHRCFCVNTQHGGFHCHRCNARGKLADFCEERPKLNRRDFARQQLRQVCELRPVEVPQPDAEQERKTDEQRERFEKLPAIEGTPGAAYLRGRGVSLEVASAASVRFSPRWMPRRIEEPGEPPRWERRAAIVFPIHDQAGELVAAQGRYTDDRDDPKTKTRGPKSRGVFAAAGAFDVPPFIITEAPIDALSLAVAGFPAVALCGSDGAPDWLPKFCFGRTVFLGFDADELNAQGKRPGDDAADKLALSLESFGATCKRLRPEGAKDWNEFLIQFGRDELARFINARVFCY